MIKKIYVFIFVLFSVIKVSAQTYCTPTLTSPGVTGDYVNNFTFATISNLNSGDNPADYQLYTQTTSVIQGLTYPFTIQSGNATWNQGLAIFIDYNDDGDFADAGELAFATTTTGTERRRSILWLMVHRPEGVFVGHHLLSIDLRSQVQ